MNSKIKTRTEIASIAAELRKQGKKIVTTNGSFDILHYGHASMLQQAKQQGDILIVGLNSDSSIKQYKSKDRPIIPQEYRSELLASLQCVDYVVIFDETTPNAFLEAIQPNVHVNDAKYGINCVEAPIVKKYGGRLHLIAGTLGGLSTTEIINKILAIYSNNEKKDSVNR